MIVVFRTLPDKPLKIIPQVAKRPSSLICCDVDMSVRNGPIFSEIDVAEKYLFESTEAIR